MIGGRPWQFNFLEVPESFHFLDLVVPILDIRQIRLLAG